MNISAISTKYKQTIKPRIPFIPQKTTAQSRTKGYNKILTSDVISRYSLSNIEKTKQRRKRIAIAIGSALLIAGATIVAYWAAIRSGEKFVLKTYANKARQDINKKTLIQGIQDNLKPVQLKTSEGNNIECWDINPLNHKQYVLFCHGNGQNLTQSQDVYKKILNHGYGVLAVDYSGYSNNTGSVTEKNLIADGKAAYDYLIKEKKISSQKIGIMGYSLGGAVATDVASKNDCKFLILLDTFNNLTDVIRNSPEYFSQNKVSKWATKLLNKFPSYMFPIKNSFKSDQKIKNVKAPITIIHAVDDHVIPYDLAKKLKNNAPPKNLNFRTLPEGGNRHFYDAAKMKAIDEALIHHHNLDIDIQRAPMISA